MSRLYLSPEESTRRPASKTKRISEKIGALTFHLYLEDGCPEGRESDFWRRARKMVEEPVVLDPTPGTSAAG